MDDAGDIGNRNTNRISSASIRASILEREIECVCVCVCVCVCACVCVCVCACVCVCR